MLIKTYFTDFEFVSIRSKHVKNVCPPPKIYLKKTVMMCSYQVHCTFLPCLNNVSWMEGSFVIIHVTFSECVLTLNSNHTLCL